MSYLIYKIEETEERVVKTAIHEAENYIAAEIFLAAIPIQMKAKNLYRIESTEEE